MVVLTARPGRVSRVMAIDLERPRTVATKPSKVFGRYTYEIRKAPGPE